MSGEGDGVDFPIGLVVVRKEMALFHKLTALQLRLETRGLGTRTKAPQLVLGGGGGLGTRTAG